MVRSTRTDLLLYDQQGKLHRAYILTNYLEVKSLDGSEIIPTTQECHSADGTPLNYVDKETFKNPITGELFRRR